MVELYRGKCRDCGTDNIDEILVTNPWDGKITITYHCKGDGCARQETLGLDQVDLVWLAKHLADLSRQIPVPIT